MTRSDDHISVAIILCLLLLAPAASGQDPGSLRTWTDSSGRHKTQAAFVRLDGESVELKLASGRLISLPLLRLSKADQQYIAGLARSATPTRRATRFTCPYVRLDAE